MRNKKVLFAVQAAMIAALYVVLTYITNLLGLASAPFRYAFLKRFASFRFHTGSHSGSFHRMSDFQSYHRRHHLGYHLRKYRYTARCTWHLLPQKKEVCIHASTVIANIIIVPLVLRYGYGLTTIYKGVDISLLSMQLQFGIG